MNIRPKELMKEKRKLWVHGLLMKIQEFYHGICNSNIKIQEKIHKIRDYKLRI